MALRNEEFWDDHYALELKNYVEDGDEGDIWFGKRLTREIVTWVIDQLDREKVLDSRSNDILILDVGCGNAHLLCDLAESYERKIDKTIQKLKLLGLDYSSNSIKLSNKIVVQRDLTRVIELKECNFLDQDKILCATGGDKYDFIIDKGTYDAICLLAEKSEELLKKSKLDYLESLYSLVKDGSIFVLASCNNTKVELLELIGLVSNSRIDSKLIHEIATPTIQFGGKSGSQVTCLIFRFNVN